MRTVCSEMLTTVETLHLIEQLQVKGWLELPESLFTDEVTVTATSWVQPGEVRAFRLPLGLLSLTTLEWTIWRATGGRMRPRNCCRGLMRQ